jgi:hypothetical protein
VARLDRGSHIDIVLWDTPYTMIGWADGKFPLKPVNCHTSGVGFNKVLKLSRIPRLSRANPVTDNA